MIACYAIIPDGQEAPSALFTHFEDAIDWGLATYGDDAFRIRYLEVAQIERADQGHAGGEVVSGGGTTRN
jgi:hypothetical protein